MGINFVSSLLIPLPAETVLFELRLRVFIYLTSYSATYLQTQRIESVRSTR